MPALTAWWLSKSLTLCDNSRLVSWVKAAPCATLTSWAWPSGSCYQGGLEPDHRVPSWPRTVGTGWCLGPLGRRKQKRQGMQTRPGVQSGSPPWGSLPSSSSSPSWKPLLPFREWQAFCIFKCLPQRDQTIPGLCHVLWLSTSPPPSPPPPYLPSR